MIPFFVVTGGLAFWITRGNPEPYAGVYRRAGVFYPLKFIVIFLILTLRKLFEKLTKSKSVSRDAPGYGVHSRQTFAEMEKVQPLSNHPKAIDAVFFSGSNREGYYFNVGIARRPNRVNNGFWMIRVPNLGLLVGMKTPDTTTFSEKDDIYATEGAEISLIEPMKKWRITFDGTMKFQNDFSHVVQVRLDLTYNSDLKHYDFDTDMKSKVLARAVAREPWSRRYFADLRECHQTHYEQFGTYEGYLEIEGQERINLSLSGLRDHSYGNKREWRNFHRYGLHNGTMANGYRFMVGVVSQPNVLSVLEVGYVIDTEGKIHSIDSIELPLHSHGENGTPPTDYGFRFKAGGRNYDVQVKVLEKPEVYLGWEWECRFVERMCAYKVNGLRAWGHAEWQYRNRSGRPDDYQDIDEKTATEAGVKLSESNRGD